MELSDEYLEIIRKEERAKLVRVMSNKGKNEIEIAELTDIDKNEIRIALSFRQYREAILANATLDTLFYNKNIKPAECCAPIRVSNISFHIAEVTNFIDSSLLELQSL